MWIVANGALKSGSTWIFQLLTSTGVFTPIPQQLQHEEWQNSSVHRSKVQQAMNLLADRPEAYVTKQHWARENAEVAGRTGIRIVNIVRDIRDVIVSRYHHDVRTFGYQGDIARFLQEMLDKLVNENVNYHAYWISAETVRPENYHITSYEYMLEEYEKACREMFAFSGLKLSEGQIAKSLEENLFVNKPRTGPGEFFRKGKAFGFVDDLTEGQSKLILQRAERAGLAEVKQRIARFNPVLVPYLAQTDLGLASISAADTP